MSPITIRYVFQLVDGPTQAFETRLHARTLRALDPIPKKLPDWTRLDFHKCPNCPLSQADWPHCPTAARVADLVEGFGNVASTDLARIRVEGPERTISAERTIAQGLSSLMGLRMATSECPVLGKLRPQTQLHIPFANDGETLFRALSVYLIAQFLRAQRGEAVDWSLTAIQDVYKAIGIVNKALSQRFRAGLTLDANANALIRLDLFAKTIAMQIEEWLHGDFTLTFSDWFPTEQ